MTSPASTCCSDWRSVSCKTASSTPTSDPTELRQIALDAHATPAEIAQRSRELIARLDDEVADAQRRLWLNRQLIAMETLAQLLGGEPLDYIEEVTRCFDAPPERTPAANYASVTRELDELLPGTGRCPRPARWRATTA